MTESEIRASLPRYPFESTARQLESLATDLVKEINVHNLEIGEWRLRNQQLFADWEQEYDRLQRVEQMIGSLRTMAEKLQGAGTILGERFAREVLANKESHDEGGRGGGVGA
jgi:hypothetical protein